jgi:MYXO-CTERM domain-containing protein
MLLQSWVLLFAVRAHADPEICNGVDDDSDGFTDEGPIVSYADTDGDGAGDYTAVLISPDCGSAPGVADSNDCDDGDNGIPGSEGTTVDGVDQDCNFAIDDVTGLPNTKALVQSDTSVFYADAAGHNWTTSRNSCPSGYDLAEIDDQAENDLLVDLVTPLSPHQFWIGLNRISNVWYWVDGVTTLSYTNWEPGEGGSPSGHNCGFLDDGGTWFNVKCDDNHSFVCELRCTLQSYGDADGDGLGDPSDVTTECAPSPGRVLNDVDCDDLDAAVGVPLWYFDGDGDGHGDPLVFEQACVVPGPDWVDTPNDCDDADAALNDDTPWYDDGDNDGYPGSDVIDRGCTTDVPGAGLVTEDCNDKKKNIHPGAPEDCNGTDDDCNDLVDDDPVSGTTTYYADSDHDGYGIDGYTVEACAPPADYADQAGDCGPDDPNVHPNAPEQCDNHVDDDCDGQVDESTTEITFYFDGDGDGYGDPTDSRVGCVSPGEGWLLDDSDCDDDDPAINPGADEIPNDGVDQDCDGYDVITTGGSGGGTTLVTIPDGGSDPGDRAGGTAADRVVGCGCGTSSPAPSGVALLALAALSSRRRSRSRS